MRKKIIAVLLACMMAASVVPMSVSATTTGEPTVFSDSGDGAGTTPVSENVASVGDTEYKTFAEAWNAVVNNGGMLTLLDDATFDQALSLNNKTVTIDLNGHELLITTSTSSTYTQGASLTIYNGSLKYNGLPSVVNTAFNIQADSSLTLNSVQMETTASALFPQGNAASVTVTNSNITAGCYCVATNAATVDNYNVIINLTNSTFTAKSTTGDNCAVMINIPGVLNMTNCEVTADRQAMLVRGGTVNISNSKLTSTGLYSNGGQYLDGNWASGNEVPNGGLIVGNRGSSAYSYKSICTISNTTISAAGSGTDRALYVYGYTDENSSTISYTGGEITGGVVLKNESTTEFEGTKVNGSVSADDAASATVDKDSQITGNVSGPVIVSPLAQVDGTNNSSVSASAKYTVNIYVDGTLAATKADQTWTNVVALIAESKVGYTQTIVETDTVITIYYTPASYDLTVNNKKTTKKYGDTVTITTPAYYQGHVFKNWVVSSDNVILDDLYSPSTFFTMPAEDVTIYAVYSEITFVPIIPDVPDYTPVKPAEPAGPDIEWVSEDGGTKLYIDDEMMTGWYENDDGWYWFDEETGVMSDDCWEKIDGVWYLFDEDGVMMTGWQKVDGKWYYLKPWGGMATGWQLIDSVWYYLRGDGSMAANAWVQSGGYWYYLTGSGEMATACWIEWKGDWYYLYSSGIMATNTTIDGCYIDSNGIWRA